MEAMVKKYQSKYKKVREEMLRWDDKQLRLLSLYDNAASIIDRLQMLTEPKNFGRLVCVDGIREALLGKQLETLETIFSSMKETMKDLHDIVMFLNKISRDSHQQLKGGSSTHQLQLRAGIRPSLAICLDGLKSIYEMHTAEYSLKLSLISALTWKSSSSDVIAIRQLLADQPNIPKDEVQKFFDIVFAEDIS